MLVALAVVLPLSFFRVSMFRGVLSLGLWLWDLTLAMIAFVRRRLARLGGELALAVLATAIRRGRDRRPVRSVGWAGISTDKALRRRGVRCLQ